MQKSIIFLINYGSGLPYTTEFAGQRTAFENNGRKPPTYNVDMRSFYHFSLSEKLKISAHINIYNLFDIRNELLVYNDKVQKNDEKRPDACWMGSDTIVGPEISR